MANFPLDALLVVQYIFYSAVMSGKQKQKSSKGENFYPYLSVDPKNKPTIHHEISNCQSLDYLNIKFDTKSELRESYFRNFRKRLTSKILQENCEPFHNKNESEESDQKKVVFAKKNILNPEQLIRPPGYKSIKQSTFFHQHRQSLHNPKRSINLAEEEGHNSQNNPISKPKCFTFNQISTSVIDAQKSLKRKKQIYQKMLKKVDQLRDIYKYEAELMNITEIKDEPPMRFHTEPIYVEFGSRQQQVKPIKKKQSILPHKISPQNRYGLYRTKAEQTPVQNRTLEVRKYRNQTSMKKRMQYLLRRQLMRQQYSISDQKIMNESKEKGTKRSRKVNDKDAVGPWDADQSTYFLRQQ